MPGGKRGRKARVCSRAAVANRWSVDQWSVRSERLVTAAPERKGGKKRGGEGQGVVRREKEHALGPLS